VRSFILANQWSFDLLDRLHHLSIARYVLNIVVVADASGLGWLQSRVPRLAKVRGGPLGIPSGSAIQ
jgi:hypothetical protein